MLKRTRRSQAEVNPLDSKGVQAAGTRETTSKETNKEVAKRSPVTLFKTAYCPACRGVSCLLGRHQIPYKALDLDQDKAAQAAFPKSLLGSDGSITVPVLQVGSQRVQGYKRSEILRTLGQVGYSTGRLGAKNGEAGDGGACKNLNKNELGIGPALGFLCWVRLSQMKKSAEPNSRCHLM